MNLNADEKVLALFKDSEALLQGHFKLTSGKHSEWYFEKIRLIEKPAALEKLVDLLVERIRAAGKDFDLVVSPAYGAIAIGFLVALKLGKRFAFTQRVKGRAFGSPLARGLYPRASTAEVDPRVKPGAPAAVDEKMSFRAGFTGIDGSRAVIVEDILTTGGSINEVVDCLKLRGVDIAGIYVLVDRTGGEAQIEGRPVGSLLSLKVEAFEPDACPFCRKGMTLTKPSASDKKI